MIGAVNIIRFNVNWCYESRLRPEFPLSVIFNHDIFKFRFGLLSFYQIKVHIPLGIKNTQL